LSWGGRGGGGGGGSRELESMGQRSYLTLRPAISTVCRTQKTTKKRRKDYALMLVV